MCNSSCKELLKEGIISAFPLSGRWVLRSKTRIRCSITMQLFIILCFVKIGLISKKDNTFYFIEDLLNQQFISTTQFSTFIKFFRLARRLRLAFYCRKIFKFATANVGQLISFHIGVWERVFREKTKRFAFSPCILSLKGSFWLLFQT